MFMHVVMNVIVMNVIGYMWDILKNINNIFTILGEDKFTGHGQQSSTLATRVSILIICIIEINIFRMGNNDRGFIKRQS